MKTWFFNAGILALCILLVTAVRAENRQIDSLRKVLPSLSGKDRLSALYALSNQLENTLPKQAMEYGLEGVLIAQQLADSSSLATLYSSLAFSFSELGEFESSLNYGYQSLDVSTRIGDKKKIASANSTLGITYVYIGQYSKALEHHLEALRLREELGLTVPIANTLNNIGLVYHHIGQYDKAIEYYKHALERNGASVTELAKVRYLTNIGYAEFKRGNFEAAMKYHTDALKIAEKSNYGGILAYIYFNLGIMHAERRENEKALGYLLQSLKYYEMLGQKYGMLQLLNAIGSTYNMMNQHKKALDYLNRAVILAKEVKAPDQLKNSYEVLYSMYDKTGPLSKAYEYYRLYSEAKDSLLNINESKKIAEVTVRHVTIEKQREIELLRNEKTIADLKFEKESTRTSILYFGIFLSIVVSTFLYFTMRRTQRNKGTVELKNEELKLLNEELNLKMSEIKLLSGLLPICANCRKIRDDNGEWERLDQYISRHSDTKFSHGICPDCMRELYGDFLAKSKPK